MPIESASALAQLGIASVTPMLTGEWRVSGVSKVGVIRLGDIEVNIEPKVPLENLFYLLARGREWGAWFEHSIRVDTVDALYPAIAQAFATWAEQVLQAGPVRGYRPVRQAEPAIRGRWLVSEQIRVRHGLPLPAELQYDEFTVDIDENQLMRSAARRLLNFSGLPEALHTRLLRIDRQLQDVTLLTRGRPLPSVHFDRRNERYRPVVALAELILTNGSLDHRVGGTSATGFLLDLPRVFERFVEAEVTRAARPYGGTIVPQLGTWLDRDSHVRIRPDLV
jgi:5-methylcytosine-specific restriction enzyme subunit McrC